MSASCSRALLFLAQFTYLTNYPIRDIIKPTKQMEDIMKLYHATKAKNIKSILRNGIRPSNCKSMAYVLPQEHTTLQGTDANGVYAWTDIEDAKWFIRENCWRYDGAIFSFDVDDASIDPEFTNCGWLIGESRFVVTRKPTSAELVCEY